MTVRLDTGVDARSNGGNVVLAVGLILIGWVFTLVQLLTMDKPGSLAEAGPGMQIFAHVKAHVFGDPFAFESTLSLTSIFICMLPLVLASAP
ncbi:hypothetical protein [uncultured Roseovarius sp.]|uniref:hypothetical protein n=1 Tax=uncultured Roseovarius sp. TaxID=293344 RepID=UPI0026246B1F|nr:hypothetical protein [uncultured Roseovarius sp.]